MTIFKTLSPDDVSRVPFNANKQFTFTSSSASTVGATIYTFEYPTSSLNTFSSASTDTFNCIKYHQLDHLFYKNHRLDISNKLGDADYLDEARNLYNKVNVLSIPSNLYGNKIQPGSFIYSGSSQHIIDDKKGNLLIEGTQLISHSVDEREKVLFLGPIKGFKQYNVNYNLYGKTTPNPKTYFNKENIYDDSYYYNTLTYKNISFSKEDYGVGINGSKIDFRSNGAVTSSIISPHNETYNFNPGEDFTISMYINPVSASSYLICKSTKESILKTPLYQPLYTTGSSQLQELKTQNQYPFEIFLDDSQNLTFRKTDGTNTPTVTAPINTGSLQHIVCMTSASQMEIWISGSKISSTTDTTIYQTENKSDLYIGSKGELSNYYTGSLSNLMIFNSSRTEEQIKSISSSINGSPYIGNIFYSNGLATVTHPKYQEIFKPVSAQVQRYYPLNSSAVSTTTNNGEGSFNDLGRYGQNSIAYTYLSASAYHHDGVTQNISTATFDTITHNGFTGELLSISASLSGGAAINHRGRESIDIPTYQFDRKGKWSLSWLMKEAPGFHLTSSVFMGADLDINDGNPLLTQPYIQYTGGSTTKISLRTKNQHDFWNSQTTITNRSSSNHHVITWDGTNEKAASMNFYWNGNLLGTHTKDISGHIDSGSFYMETIGAGYWTSGRTTYGYSGSIGQVMFFDHLLTTESIQALNQNPSQGEFGDVTNKLQFKNIHPIYENEYMCTINADEYNYTHNISTRKIKSDQKPDLANFATGSLFKPYVTTVGLYNEDHELLVVGKLGQAIRMSDETDTTFVLRWDT